MHPLLEKEHQQLINLLDATDKCVSNGNSANQVYKYLGDFIVLAEAHFKNEEVIMEDYEYPDIINHKKEHADLLEQLFILKSRFDNGHTPFGRDFMQSLKKWLEKHFDDSDNKLDEFLYQTKDNRNALK